ncbi:hypothetical protein EJ08DRAFT_647087 [Tothia fuscella]|uniref:Centrosomin N-terminal motif 1 domain-containing protein n=1 Tax=Tothia fuscella TaxID=1048955 RepID=A0A9P4NWS9_9PEZI|nr:hypothetical protein EJ08DRAFT_647087 [Tothia fuscella]
MAHLFVGTPQTEVSDRTRMTFIDNDLSSELPSFMPPSGADDLLGAVRSKKGTVLSTPRQPLAQLGRNKSSKNEFTPLLKSAMKNRMRNGEAKENYGVPATPALLKPGYHFSSPNVPEASIMDTSMSLEHTPYAPVDSSSAMSTPMALPKGQLGVGGDGGNVLTLREQEAKLALIDKENFGLKLKIHFLEENLKRSGSEWNQQAIRENTELKTNSVMMEHELKKYRKQFTVAERELEQYRQQLRDYAEKMKRRHMDEGMREELDRLQALADDREKQMQEMQAQLDNADKMQSNNQESDKLMEDVEDLETELKEKEQLLDEREEEIETLKSRLQLVGGELDAELEEKERRIEDLEAEVQRLSSKDDGERDDLQDQLDSATREHEAELEDLRKKAEIAERDKREQLRLFETRLQSYSREKNAELEAAERKIEALEKDKVDEIESLELRLKLAESKGDNSSQLAQQAAQDARDSLKRVTQEKDIEMESLRSQINAFEGVQDELEACQKQLRDHAEDVKARHAAELRQEEAMDKLRDSLAEKDRELRTVRNSIQERDMAIQEIDKMRTRVEERTSEVSALQKTVDAQATSLQELRQARASLADLERKYATTTTDVQKLQAAVNDRDRQLDTLRRTLEDRTNELEILRQGNEEPDTQIEGLQSIVRHRDQNLEELRETVDEQNSKLEALQRTAEERLRNIEELREVLTNTKQDLEDEVAVLEGSLDEAEDKKEELEAKIRTLEIEMQGTYELQAKFEPVEKDLRTAQREKTNLQKKIESLERDRDVADDERISLQSTIDTLRKDLKTAQKVAEISAEVESLRERLSTTESALAAAERKAFSSPDRARLAEDIRLQQSEKEASLEAQIQALEVTHRQTIQEKTRTHTIELKKLHDLLRTSTLEVESLNLRITSAEQELSRVPHLQKELKDKERQLREYAAADTTKQLHSKAQEAREEAGRLRVEIMDKEKRHAGELRGLAKQITWLRSRCSREERFREGLSWQKKWFLMNVEMYNACNQADLKLIEEMGITPNREIRDRRPTLKTVAQMFIFCHRTKKLSGQWGESKKIHKELVKKLEIMRGRTGRRSGKA